MEDQFIIIHGANALRDQLAKDLNAPKKVLTSVSGYTSVYSDESALDLLMMAYAGLRNKRLVELCQQNGINAVGLTGLDGRMVQGARNKGIRVKENGKLRMLRDFSGKPKSINSNLLHLLLENGYTPVLTVPIADEHGFAVNSENDDIVTVLQNTVRAETVIQLIEAPGYLMDLNNPDSLIKEMKKEELTDFENRVEGRMKRKILALRKLCDAGAGRVLVGDGRADRPVLDILSGKGTTIQ
jgi:acetylglutamate/LysW-gamma-L-alpha-aminoadipate kinase